MRTSGWDSGWAGYLGQPGRVSCIRSDRTIINIKSPFGRVPWTAKFGRTAVAGGIS